MACIAMAYIGMAYIGMAYTVMACIVMAYMAMGYTAMAYTVMACGGYFRAMSTMDSGSSAAMQRVSTTMARELTMKGPGAARPKMKGQGEN